MCSGIRLPQWFNELCNLCKKVTQSNSCIDFSFLFNIVQFQDYNIEWGYDCEGNSVDINFFHILETVFPSRLSYHNIIVINYCIFYASH